MSAIDQAETQKALEDIGMIKEILKRTSLSLISLGRTFIQLGLLMLGLSTILIASNYIPIPGYETGAVLAFVIEGILIYGSFFALLFIIAVLVRRVIRHNSLSGVSKQIIILWIYIMSLDVALVFLPHILYLLLWLWKPSIVFAEIVPMMSVQFLLCAIGLACISIFTKFKFPLILSSVYVLVGLSLFMIEISFDSFYLLVLPVTMIIIGIDLQLMKARVK